MRHWLAPVLFAAVLLQACAPGALGPALSGPALVNYLRGLEPKRYLTAALDDMQNVAYYSGQLDWPAIRRDAYRLAENARVPADTYPAIESAVSELSQVDHHSSFFPAAALQAFLGLNQQLRGSGLLILVSSGLVVQVLPSSPAEQAGVRLGDVVESVDGKSPRAYLVGRFGAPAQDLEVYGYFDQPVHADVRRPDGGELRTLDLRPSSIAFNVQPTGRRIGPIGYLQVTGFLGINPFDSAYVAYSSKVAGLIEQQDRAGSCGWIVDLRQNGGGNVGPMAAGLADFLGPGPYASSIFHNDRYDYTTQPVTSYRLKHSHPPIAVLTSPLTASSGELVAIAFRGRSNWRSFGEPSDGATSSTQQLYLNDGAILNLMVAIDADRTGRTYGDKLQPDQPVAIDWTRYGQDDDPVVAAALTWLRQQPGCV